MGKDKKGEITLWSEGLIYEIILIVSLMHLNLLTDYILAPLYIDIRPETYWGQLHIQAYITYTRLF